MDGMNRIMGLTMDRRGGGEGANERASLTGLERRNHPQMTQIDADEEGNYGERKLDGMDRIMRSMMVWRGGGRDEDGDGRVG